MPSENNIYNLGSTGLRWADLYMGPGTLNIAGPIGSTGFATIGSDDNSIAYSQFGFATPFINIGPAIQTDKAVGGWQIYSTGASGTSSFDLVVQQNSTTGTFGPVYSLINNPRTTYTISTILTDENYSDLLNIPGEFDFYQLNTTDNPIFITLPSISSLTGNKRVFTFSDVGGNLSNNNIILNTSGGDEIGNSTEVVMNINYSSLQIASNGINRWIIF